MISGPANRVGLDIDPQLHSLLTTEATGADALPLLAFTLERLYTERLEPERITLADYNRLGGAAGAIAAAADAVRQRAILAGVPQEHYDALLRRVFLPHLARVNEAGEFARRIAKRSDLDAASQPLVDLLIEQRLLVMDQVGDAPTLEVAHEAILREWPLLAGWLNAEKGFLEWREEIARTRKLADAGQGDLLTGRGLAVAQSFIDTREADIAEVDRVFIRASIDAEQAQKRAEEERQELVRQAELTAAQAREEAAQTEAEAQKRIAQQAKRATRRLSLLAVLMAMFAVGAAGAGYWAYMSQQDAVFAQKESESRRLASLASDLRDQGGDDKAMALSWLALPHDEAMTSTPITDEAASELYHQSYLSLIEIEDYADTIFPKQGPYLVSLLAGDRAIVWHSETLEVIAEFDGLMGIEQYYRRMEPVSFTSDGETLHIFQNGELQIFNIPERRVTRTLALPLYNPNRRDGIDPPMVYAASDSGRLLFVGTDDGEFGAVGVEFQAYLYDVASGRRLADLSVGADTLYPPDIEEWDVGGRLDGFDGAFFSPDESLVATAYYEWKNGLLFLWDVETGQMRDVISGSGSFQSVDYSPDNRFVLARSAVESITDLNADPDDYESRTAYLGNQLHDGLDRKSFDLVGPDQPYTADTPGVFHSDEWDNVVRLWEEEPSPHPDTFPPAWAVDTRGIAEQLGILDTTEAFLPLMYASIDSGHVLVSGDGPGECGRVYNIRTDQFLGTLTTGSGECSPHALSPDGRLAFVNSCEVDEFGFQANENCQNRVHVFELTPTTPVQRDSSWTPVDLVTLAEDQAMLVNVDGESFHRLNMAGEPIETAGFDSQIAAIAVHNETQTAVIGDWRGGIWRYDLSDMEAEPVELGRHVSAVSAVAMSEDGRSFASGAHDGTLRFGSMDGGESTVASDRHNASVSALAYSAATDNWVASSFDGTVRVWTQGRPSYEDTAHGAAVHDVAHQVSGEQVVSASEDGTLRLWSISLPDEAITLTGHEAAVTSVKWSADGTQFLSLSDDRTAKVWRADGRLDFTLSGHIDGLSTALFTEDRKLIITADRSGQIRIWDRPSGALLSVRQTDGTTVRGLAHLDSGKSLLAVTASGTTFRWRLAPGGLKERIASVAETVSGLRPLTARECAQYYLSDLPGADRVCMSEEMMETIEAAEL